uniref:ATP-dependent transporter ycf16 n=1 Tax=Hemiselmis andersenii TaxID=464988 RepID=A0A6T8KKU6_HEMAN|mmetsp:Transcript_21700/g.52797  ORF Transcript_21700/g.52797 Transcript_21700/m.52797 type:complete len:1566 (+) Transcript_21700:82-4779(+)
MDGTAATGMNMSWCREGDLFSLMVRVEGQQRFGPSFCMMDGLFAPLVLVALAILGGHRVNEISRRESTKTYLNFDSFFDAAQFGLAVMGILFGASTLVMGSSRAEWMDGMVLAAKFGGTLGVLMIENKKDVLRGKNIKCFWIIDFLYTLMRIRFVLMLKAFGNVLDSELQHEGISFIISVTIMMTGMLQKPMAINTGSTAFSQLKETEMEDLSKLDAGTKKELDHIKQFQGRGEGAASWWSQMLFNWITELLVAGKQRQLDAVDLFPLLEKDTCFDSGVELSKYWNVQKAKLGTSEEPSLFKAIRGCWGRDFMIAGVWKLINDLVVFLGPLFLRALIQFVESGNDKPLEGAMLAVGIFGAKMVETIALGQYFQRGYRVGGQVRSGLVHLVYRKSFMLSSRGRQRYKLGEMVSLMSVDAQRLCGVAPYLHQFWSAPVQLFISVYLLYNTVGPSVFAGMLLMVLLIPVNTYIARKQTEIQRNIMKIKDERSNTMDEVLQGIRIIKYFAWEPSFVTKIGEIRQREVDLLWKNGLWGVASMFLWGGSPMLVALITFLTYSLTGNELKASVAFTALALFNVMRFPLNTLPMIINFIVEGRTALNRLCKYLLADEVDQKYYRNVGTPSQHEMARVSVSDKAIIIRDGRFSWARDAKEGADKPAPEKKAAKKKSMISRIFDKGEDDDGPPAEYVTILRDINLEVKPGELLTVCGPVGSGKSSLLGAILGDMKKEDGEVELHGRVSYVAQQTWITNATLKDNILFGAPFNQERYDEVIEVCALLPDFEMLPGGDQTEIGEKGINLSGGQKARVALARAVYQDADVYLLDDPLSAVDVHVSKILFEQCICGYLRGKTRVLVTHQVQYLPGSDRVAVVDQSRVVACGTYDEVVETQPHLIQAAAPKKAQKEAADEDKTDEGSSAGAASPAAAAAAKPAKKKPTLGGKRAVSRTTNSQDGDAKEAKKDGKTTTTETRSKGSVAVQVWKRYAECMGMAIAFYLVGSYVFSQCAQLASDWSLGLWSGDVSAYEANMEEFRANGGEEPARVDTALYLSAYGGLTILAIFTVTVRGFLCVLGSIRAAVVLHDTMLANVLRAPTKFFDTTPTGRVLNRFSTDQYTADNELRQTIQMMLMCLMRVACVGIVILWVTPAFVVCVIPMGFVYWKVQKFYRQSSREIKRLESVAKSPIFAEFSQTVTGVSTIRAFGKQDNFSQTCFRLNDGFSRAYYANNSANRWLAIRLEFIGNVAVGASALFAVVNAGDPSTAGLVGLSISYALEVTGVLNWLIRTFTQLESYMVAVERIDEYSRMETEAPTVIEDSRPGASWPQQGTLIFDDVWMRYREELDPALRGVSFTTKPGEKIGIVGRTGAGKSSLAVCLFRMTEIYKGEVRLDGVNAKTIGLHDLRSRMSIIPQDPVLFSGTVRKNLDPFDERSDFELWESLEKVHLKEFVKGQAEGLDYPIQEGGQNLSVGQRQLMSMGRALLRKAKVIVMDEATASVDMQTDEAIQETMRTEFKNTTVLTIAHRLATVMACDRVMVMGEGRVLEIGPPKELMEDEKSVFHVMTSDSHAVDEFLG